MNNQHTGLIDLCIRHTLPAGVPAVLPEPYFPHMPANWNGVLVLGEAQHLGRKNDAYRQALLALDPIARFSRLNAVARKIQEHPDWLAKYRTNKIAYACHMVECVNASVSPADSRPKPS